jgi:hypothetical protein
MKVNCQLRASATLMPREITVGSHLRGGCLGPRGGEENMHAPTWNWNTVVLSTGRHYIEWPNDNTKAECGAM